ncbi:MAG TPA: pyridoxal-phosphate dependent enzyme [Bacteroidia bacterium]|nr:pyridoxal-phosphate dependent enzyme [Bacteroidia bacterium]
MPKNIAFQKIENELTIAKKVTLYLLRLDTIDLYAGGNKLFKLKYNLEEAQKQGYKKILTFGGAWSNHLAAVAAVNNNPLPIIAVVRGEEPKIYSDTLNFCKEKGVELHFVSRTDYRNKTEPDFIESLKNKFGNFYLLPEGGSNTLAVKGCKEIIDYISIDFDYICTPVGSGGTLAGITTGLKAHQQAIGFSALKGADYLTEEINKLIESSKPQNQKFSIIGNYHFGGYAKITPELLAFKTDFEKTHQISLDYVYTSKMMYGIFDKMQKGYFKEGSIIVAVHTGGLQGNKGFEK